jgi:hypothetical protein
LLEVESALLHIQFGLNGALFYRPSNTGPASSCVTAFDEALAHFGYDFLHLVARP